MWDYEGFLGKAQLYFTRAEAHAREDDEGVFATWLLLGLEFLLRAPLAKANPTLLADLNGDSIMHAAGFPTRVEGATPKSIQTKTVISRLGFIIADFNKDRESDASVLTGIRNQELHSSDSPLDTSVETWLPQFTRLVRVICDHLDLSPGDIVGEQILAQGQLLVDTADKKLEFAVAKRISSAETLFGNLRPEEIASRRQLITKQIGGPYTFPIGMDSVAALATDVYWFYEMVACPACKSDVPMRLQSVRATNERLDGSEIVRDVVYVSIGLACPVCSLELTGTFEVRAASLPQQFVRTEREYLESRYGVFDDEPDYGND